MIQLPDFVTECVICKKPLGQESRDLEYFTCAAHRHCAICSHAVPPQEIKVCYLEHLETLDGNPNYVGDIIIQHSRCSALSRKSVEQDPSITIKQSYLDYLNAARLVIEPDMELSRETNEKMAELHVSRWLADKDTEFQLLTLRRMEAIAAHISIRLKKDRKIIEAELDKREKAKWEKAQREAKTSARPTTKKADDSGELAIAEFMQRFDIKDRKIAMDKMKKYEKAVAGLMSVGLDRGTAEAAVEKQFRK